MIILPSSPAPRHVEEEPLDFGLVQRPSTGAPATRIDRPGLRTKASFVFPPMPYATARAFHRRLKLAKSEGLRIPWPLMGGQGAPGNPVVNGNDSAGTTLKIKSATPGYAFVEGYYLNVVDNDGVHYLHDVGAATVSGAGTATLSVWPPLRADLVDGNLVVIDEPKIEGLVTELSPLPRDYTRIVPALEFTLEEMA